MNKTKILLAIIALFLSGCSFIPKYVRPAAPVPAEFPFGQAHVQAEQAAAKEIKWQEVFADEKLRQVIEIGLLNNRDLRLAVLNVEKARNLYGIQKAELFPAINATAAGSKQRVPAKLSATGSSVKVEKYSVDLGITAWEIDLFGRIRSLKAQALEQYLAAEEVQRSARISLISEIARAYLALGADLENLQLARSTLETQRSVYGVIWQQYDQGIANAADLQRSQTQVDTALRDIARYTQLVEQDRNALDLLAGSPVPPELLPVDLNSITAFGDIAPGLSSNVLLHRPDIIAAEHNLKASYAFVGASRAAFFPQISLTTVLGTASDDLSGLFVPESKAWSVAGQAVMAVLDARILAAYNVSKTDSKIAVIQYEKTVQTAFREVADTLSVRSTVDEELAAQESIVNSNRKIYELSRQRYDQGVDNYLNVLDAQRSLYLSRQILTSARLLKLANHVQLYAVLGGDGSL